VPWPETFDKKHFFGRELFFIIDKKSAQLSRKILNPDKKQKFRFLIHKTRLLRKVPLITFVHGLLTFLCYD